MPSAPWGSEDINALVPVIRQAQRKEPRYKSKHAGDQAPAYSMIGKKAAGNRGTMGPSIGQSRPNPGKYLKSGTNETRTVGRPAVHQTSKAPSIVMFLLNCSSALSFASAFEYSR